MSPSRWSVTSATQGEQRLGVGEDVALVVDEREALAVGVDHRAEVGARRPHEVGDVLGVGVAVEARSRPAVEAYGFTASTSAPELGQHVRHHERGRAVGVVDHDLEPGRRGSASMSTVASSAAV